MALIVAGTGTDVGKTLASALIMARHKDAAIKSLSSQYKRVR
jgi:dethiobiotin synthetase